MPYDQPPPPPEPGTPRHPDQYQRQCQRQRQQQHQHQHRRRHQHQHQYQHELESTASKPASPNPHTAALLGRSALNPSDQDESDYDREATTPSLPSPPSNRLGLSSNSPDYSNSSRRLAIWPLSLLPPLLCAPRCPSGSLSFALPALPPFPYNHHNSNYRYNPGHYFHYSSLNKNGHYSENHNIKTMSQRQKSVAVPTTPRVISPSPTPSDHGQHQKADDAAYTGPVTRSAARRRGMTPQLTVDEGVELSADEAADSHPDLTRARSRSRSPMARSVSRKGPSGQRGAATPEVIPEEEKSPGLGANGSLGSSPRSVSSPLSPSSPSSNGHLAPPSITSSVWSWRNVSRSPSPLGLIPIHRRWRTFIHKHEVPRKALHVSIGFMTLYLYLTGRQPAAVPPWLLALMIPIITVDYLRLHFDGINRFYVGVLGAFMRESEFSRFNGVVFYMLGAWIVLRWFPKDVAMTSVLLLSWCDTAASTVGRLYGRYTPRIRKGKSLAGSLAAFVVGVASSALFWGWASPQVPDADGFPSMYRGYLHLPEVVTQLFGWEQSMATVSGAAAVGVLSLWSGFVAAASEAVDLFGWDDNLTIPVLSGIGIWGFLKVFG